MSYEIYPGQSNLNDPALTTLLFAVLVKRLGGCVKITQADIDSVAYNRLEERGNEDDSVEFRLVERNKAS